jgi:hypothetical protein
MKPFSARIIRSFVAGTISIAFIYLITEIFWEFVPIIWIIILFLVFITLYSVLLLSLGTLQQSDLEILRALERKAGLKNKWLRRIIRKFIKNS